MSTFIKSLFLRDNPALPLPQEPSLRHHPAKPSAKITPRSAHAGSASHKAAQKAGAKAVRHSTPHPTPIHAHAHTHTYTYMHTHTHTHTHTHYRRAHTNTYHTAHTYVHIIHTPYKYTRIHTYAHIHTYTTSNMCILINAYWKQFINMGPL
jgi:hypothetical protein